MNPEPITTDLETSKALKEAGWPQDASGCYFMWMVSKSIAKLKDWEYAHMWDDEAEPSPYKVFAAPTCEEILRRLPRTFTYNEESVWLECCPMCNEQHPGWEINTSWLVRYAKVETMEGENNRRLAYETCEDTLANAAAAMWIYLKENGLLTAK